MANDIEVVIVLKDFALDIHFERDVEDVLISMSEIGLTYTKNKSKNEIEFRFIENLINIQNKLVPMINDLIAQKDNETQTNLSHQNNILLKYKMCSSTVGLRESSFEDFKTYIRPI